MTQQICIECERTRQSWRAGDWQGPCVCGAQDKWYARPYVNRLKRRWLEVLRDVRR